MPINALRISIVATVVFGGVSATTGALAAFPGTNGNIAYVVEGPYPGQLRIEGAFLGAEGAFVPDVPSLPYNAVGRGGSFDPSWSADGRRLAFTSSRAGRRQIYSIEPSGYLGPRSLCPEACPIVSDGAEDYEPAWSPSGNAVAFAGTRAGNPQIYEAAPATGAVRRLTFDGSADSQPTWSSRGQIAFVSDATGVPEVYMLGSQGAQPQQITRGSPSVDPEFSRDGRGLAYASRTAAGFQIFTVKLDTGETRQLTSAGLESRHPRWSPDGTKLLVARGPDYLHRVRLEVISATSGTTIAQPRALSADGQSDWGSLPAATGSRALGGPASNPAPSASRDKAIVRPLQGVVTVNPGHSHPTSTPALEGAPPSVTPAAILTKAVEVPVNSIYNVTQGVAQLVVPVRSASAASTAVVSGGRFALVQRSAVSTPRIGLLGRPRRCGRARRASLARRRGGSFRVRAHTKGRWRMAGNYGHASSQGTGWEVIDTCRGTLYVALEHSITVTDPGRKRRIRVTAGHRYLVRPGRA
jgi:dipeptidyl aminopeptidase/acylaminoacyl peptidase